MSEPLENERQEEREVLTTKFDSIFDHVGGSGRWQWRVFFLGSYSLILVAFGNLSAAFIAGDPEFWCEVPELGNYSRSFHDYMKNRTKTTNANDGSCSYYRSNLSDFMGETSLVPHELGYDDDSHIDCTAWEYDTSVFKHTIVAEWDLVCGRLWMKSTSQSTYMLGVLLGGLVMSELSDMYGRKQAACVSSLLLVVTTASVALTNDYISFVVLRFFSSMFGIGCFLATFVLYMEVAAPKSRGRMGNFFQIAFSLGVVLLPGVSYLAPRWRTLQIVFAAFGLLMVLFCWLLPESPRWLLQNGRTEEALEVFQNMAKVNGKKSFDREKIRHILESSYVEPAQHKGFWKSISIFFTNQAKLYATPVLRRRSLIMLYSFFVVAIVFYGLSLNASNFNTTPYVLFVTGGLGDITGLFLASYMIKRVPRRVLVSVAFLVCGLSCLATLFISREGFWPIVSVISFGKIWISVAFSLMFLLAAELYPTTIRTTAVGGSSLWARVGGAVAPYIVDILGQLHHTIPTTLFGVMSIIGALLIWLLPETQRKPLPETIEEVEQMSR